MYKYQDDIAEEEENIGYQDLIYQKTRKKENRCIQKLR